jgi:hypothetical protein
MRKTPKVFIFMGLRYSLISNLKSSLQGNEMVNFEGTITGGGKLKNIY